MVACARRSEIQSSRFARPGMTRSDDHELHHRRRADVLRQARRLVLARSHEQGGRACHCRCRAEAIRDRRHSLRLFDGFAAHHAGDRVRRAFWHSAILRARRAGRRRHRSRHDHAGASSGRRRRGKACAGGRRRKSSHRAEPRRLDPGAGAGRSPRLRGDAWGRRSPPITASSPRATCTNMASPRKTSPNSRC